MFKSGFVAVIGRPNVGKSTLINNLLHEKLSIVSSRPQTTRNNIKGILTKEDYQIVFVDTPGIHKPRHKLGEYMVKSASESVKDVDAVIFITIPCDNVSKADAAILEDLKKTEAPVFLVLNKIDNFKQDKVAETLAMYSEIFDFKEIIPISALRGKNTETLMELILQYINEGPKYYPDDILTDVQERFVISEIIREKALRFLNEEVPHGIAVEIISMKKGENEKYNIEAEIICEKESHKGIIIGKNGSMLKRIEQSARRDMEKFTDSKVKLKVWVKVRREWRDNSAMLRQFGYDNKK